MWVWFKGECGGQLRWRVKAGVGHPKPRPMPCCRWVDGEVKVAYRPEVCEEHRGGDREANSSSAAHLLLLTSAELKVWR